MKLPDFLFTDFPHYDTLVQTLHDLQQAAPDLMKLEILGKSREGRDLYLVTLADLTQGSPEDRPAIYFDGDLHPHEQGRIHLMYIMRLLLQQHENDGILSRRTFYFLPSINPDGVEHVLNEGVPFVRSSLPVERDMPDTLYPSDVNGDGKIMWIRIQCDDGDMMEDPQDRRIMMRREPGAKGPFYKIIPEGMIENWSGAKEFDMFRAIDWDASFPVTWEPHRTGGDFMPLDEPELRLSTSFISHHPNICGVFSLHVGGGSLVLPPNRLKLNLLDEAFYASIGRDYTAIVGLEARPSIDVHVPPWWWYYPSGDRPGTLVDYIHYTFGIPGFDFEMDGLYDYMNVHIKDLDNLTGWDEYNDLQRRMMAFYDDQCAKSKTKMPDIFMPWKKFHHPQFGDVEIGGTMVHVTYIRPLHAVPDECEKVTKFFTLYANQTPQAAITDLSVTPMGEKGLYKISARAFNAGLRSTNLTQRATEIWGSKIPRIDFIPENGVTVKDGIRGKKTGHLNGYASTPVLEWLVQVPEGVTALGRLQFNAWRGGIATKDVRLA